jgi:hypothetical protein
MLKSGAVPSSIQRLRGKETWRRSAIYIPFTFMPASARTWASAQTLVKSGGG